MGVLARRLRRLSRRPDVRATGPGAQHESGFAAELDVFTRSLPQARSDQPDSGSLICDGLTLYHDADAGRYSWQQTPDNKLKLTIYQFQGSYISLAIGIDEHAVRAMRHGGFLSVTQNVLSTRPLASFLRLNVQIDGRHEKMHQTFIVDRGDRTTCFDLDGLPGEFGPIDDAWLDLIFADPQMVEIVLTSLSIDGTAPAMSAG